MNEPWDVPINDPSRLPGEDAKVAIAEDWIIPFDNEWKREVVYRYDNPKACDIYYMPPDGAKLRSHNEAVKYFKNNPNSPLSPTQLCWLRKPIGLNNLFYEIIRRAKKRDEQGIKSEDIPLGFSAVSPATPIRSPNSVVVLPSDHRLLPMNNFSPPWYRPAPAPSSASTLPNSVYSTTDLRSRSPIVLDYHSYLWEPIPVHIEKNLDNSTKPIHIHQFNGIISRRNWYLAMVRRIDSKEIPNETRTTIQILSGR